MNKTNAVLGIVFGSVISLWLIIGGLVVSYQYSKNYSVYWNLADKASTIAQKSEYINKFVNRLEVSGLQGVNSALFFQTENTSFDENLKALKSLQGRLNEIKKMDEQSFAYQTAIQQITEQEQGEADSMTGELRSSWMRVHHPFFWNELLVCGAAILGLFLLVWGLFKLSDY